MNTSPKPTLTSGDAPGWYLCDFRGNTECWWYPGSGDLLSPVEGRTWKEESPHLSEFANFRGPLVVEGELAERLALIRSRLEEIVRTVEPDAGVVMLSQDGPTHPETHGGKTIQVYDHEYFSPLGDALMEVWKMTEVKQW